MFRVGTVNSKLLDKFVCWGVWVVECKGRGEEN